MSEASSTGADVVVLLLLLAGYVAVLTAYYAWDEISRWRAHYRWLFWRLDQAARNGDESGPYRLTPRSFIDKLRRRR